MANAGHIIMNGRLRTSSPKRPAPVTSKEWLQQRLDDRPETAGMQRMKTKTPDERAKGAIDSLTRDHMISAQNSGKEVSEEKIRAEMTQVAERAERKKVID